MLNDTTSSDVLTVDRNATLTLGTDALIVLDEGLRDRRRAATNCCGLLPGRGGSKTTRAIPFYHVLWAEVVDFNVTIRYARLTGKKSCRVGTVSYGVADKAHAEPWVERLLRKAYPAGTQRRRRFKVLINPFGGQGYALKLWEEEVEAVFAAAGCVVDVERTAYRGHAVEIAEKIDVDAYDVVACASGDGLPHEVFNGLAKRADAGRALRRLAVVQIPCGSGNAMSLNLNGTDSPSLAALAIVKGERTPLDLVAITQGREKYYSFLSQAIGIVAESDLGTESLRWMGSLRFTWGILVRLLSKTLYPVELSVVLDSDDKRGMKEAYRQAVSEHQAAKSKQLPSSTHADSDSDHHEDPTDETPPSPEPTLQYGTIASPLHPAFQTHDLPTLGNFYVGNMCWMSPDACFFATARPADGKMDMINISGTIPRATGLRMLATAGDGTLIDFPEVSYRKVLAYRVTPRMHATPSKSRGLISVDGERVPFEPFQAEVVRGLGTVLSRRVALYEFDGVEV
ncbi:ATP-NAD kinase-like domain-containing protein [Neohortaea acidophila]|uniref:ATP-NAD kinase-like domain-containing protein n=1 Tax=Neohortaea acidophila TaxID=245834 RepID=A0A6A6Q3G7_9PEZI|nr:ATP-NAD kinase-like domain-containing protein [Neohortaea acidophila]KAF2486822.1 ATP-NAD kinase-like domain-containing protein [Neohortaea acidophila]